MVTVVISPIQIPHQAVVVEHHPPTLNRKFPGGPGWPRILSLPQPHPPISSDLSPSRRACLLTRYTYNDLCTCIQ